MLADRRHPTPGMCISFSTRTVPSVSMTRPSWGGSPAQGMPENRSRATRLAFSVAAIVVCACGGITVGAEGATSGVRSGGSARQLGSGGVGLVLEESGGSSGTAGYSGYDPACHEFRLWHRLAEWRLAGFGWCGPENCVGDPWGVVTVDVDGQATDITGLPTDIEDEW